MSATAACLLTGAFFVGTALAGLLVDRLRRTDVRSAPQIEDK